MKTERFYEHRILNIVQTLLLLLGMSAILGVLGYILAGELVAFWLIALIIPLLLLSPKISSRFVLRLYGAKPLPSHHAPYLYEITDKLSHRAELPSVPAIYYLPTQTVAIFTLGGKSNPCIVVSIGLLQLLNRYETGGVIAHEIAHIRNNDLWLMSIADFISRITGMLSVAGLVVLMLLLPLLILSGNIGATFVALLIVTFAPYLNILLQLGLSRVREYRADITAAYLSGETRSLASALGKIDSVEQNWLQQLVFPGKTVPVPSLFRTHPSTEERIKRLEQLILPPDIEPLFPDEEQTVTITLSPFSSRRRDFFRGLWF